MCCESEMVIFHFHWFDDFEFSKNLKSAYTSRHFQMSQRSKCRSSPAKLPSFLPNVGTRYNAILQILAMKKMNLQTWRLLIAGRRLSNEFEFQWNAWTEIRMRSIKIFTTERIIHTRFEMLSSNLAVIFLLIMLWWTAFHCTVVIAIWSVHNLSVGVLGFFVKKKLAESVRIYICGREHHLLAKRDHKLWAFQLFSPSERRLLHRHC